MANMLKTSVYHGELLKTNSRELLLEFKMVNESIQNYGTTDGTLSYDELMELLSYRQKLTEVIIEKMSFYDENHL